MIDVTPKFKKNKLRNLIFKNFDPIITQKSIINQHWDVHDDHVHFYLTFIICQIKSKGHVSFLFK